MDCAGGVRETPGAGWAAHRPSETTRGTSGGYRRGPQSRRGLVALESLQCCKGPIDIEDLEGC